MFMSCGDAAADTFIWNEAGGLKQVFIFCLVLWIVLNGRITWEILLIGLVVSAAVSLWFRKMAGLPGEKVFFRKIPGKIRLGGYLVAEIVRANLKVIRMVYGRKKPDSCLVSVSPPLRSGAARVALSDCITLTPGTITADLEGDSLTVHCLDRSMAEGLEDSGFVRRLQAIEDRGEKK